MSVILPSSLQQGIQEALPVIPNNGNPGGAYNAPSQEGQQAAAALLSQQQDPQSWLAPSPWMNVVGKIMDDWDNKLFDTIGMTGNPNSRQNFIPVVQGGRFGIAAVNDYGEPSSFNPEAGGLPYADAMAQDYERLPQYVPLP